MEKWHNYASKSFNHAKYCPVYDVLISSKEWSYAMSYLSESALGPWWHLPIRHIFEEKHILKCKILQLSQNLKSVINREKEERERENLEGGCGGEEGGETLEIQSKLLTKPVWKSTNKRVK